MPLSTKIQYATYEPGEFTEEKERTYEETIQLIESFPWEAQRDHLAVALTNPSVTIGRPEGDYLKLALYYQGKFVLHYFNNRKELYTRSFTDYHDAYPIIQSFFKASPPDLTGFRMETTWPRNISIHFITNVLLILILWTRIFLLLINHYRNAAGKVLILSNGHAQRYKYGNDHSRLTRVEIYFNQVGIINFSCLMMSQRDLLARLSPPVSQLEETLFPFIAPSASIPS